MSRFQLSQIPYPILIQILSKVEPEASLNLLKTNRTLRCYVLTNGPFPERIKELSIYGYNPQTSQNGSINVGQMMISINTGSQDFCLLVKASRETEESINWMTITPQDFGLLRKMRYCQDLRFELQISKTDDFEIPIYDALPNLRFLRTLQLNVWIFPMLAPIFSNLAAKVDQEFKLLIRARNYDDQSGKNDQLCEFITRNLTDCDDIYLCGVHGLYEEPSVYAALQKTNFSRLRVMLVGDADIWTTVEEVLRMDNFNRSKETEIEIKGVGVGEKSANSEYSATIDVFLREFTEKIEDSVEQDRICTKLTNREEIQHSQGHGSVETVYFRRKLSEESTIFYIFQRFFEQMRFYVKVELSQNCTH